MPKSKHNRKGKDRRLKSNKVKENSASKQPRVGAPVRQYLFLDKSVKIPNLFTYNGWFETQDLKLIEIFDDKTGKTILYLFFVAFLRKCKIFTS